MSDERDDAAWAAVATRDAAADGAFVYAVRTTGIYCRPSCASRQPRRENVAFFATPDDAELAGFRACRRCHPREERAPVPMARAVARARAHLDAHPDEAPTLAELARVVGASAAHLQRAFTRLVGVSPKQYHEAGRVARFKTRLRAGDTVSEAGYAAGYGSSRGVYEGAAAALGMTPAAYRKGGAGERIGYALRDTTLGRLVVAATARGVCAVALADDDATLLGELAGEFPRAERVPDESPALGAWADAIVASLEGRGAGTAELPLDLRGTEFQLAVWRALREIPAGETRSYQAVAAALGRPTATRAVARACATNRAALVVPCHRVVREGGAVSGYRWGVGRKRELLRREKRGD